MVILLAPALPGHHWKQPLESECSPSGVEEAGGEHTDYNKPGEASIWENILLRIQIEY